jgi:DNA-binding MarR family transcriptional regulator
LFELIIGIIVNKKTTLHIAEYSQILSQIISELFLNTFLKEYGPEHLSKTQFSTLRILSVAGTHAVSEIADILHISRAAASKNVEKLVRQKLVIRKYIEEDRRIVQVSLTLAGSALVNDYEQMSLKKQNEALTQFTENERKVFSELLGKYVRNCLLNETNVEAICMQCKGNLGEECTISEFNQNCRHYLKSS